MTPPSRLDAEHALARAQSDPEFEAGLRSAYRGRHDVLDALWWAAYPLTDSPRGVSDPAAGLRELQRAAFSRAAAEAPAVEVVDSQTGERVRMRESEHQLHQAQRLLAKDAQHLADAIGAGEPAVEHQPAVPGSAQDEFVPDPPTRPRRKILLPVLSGAVLVGAIVGLPALSQLNADAEPEPTSTARPAERTQTDIVRLAATGNVRDPLAILERPQTEADRPPLTFPGVLEPDSARALPDLVGHVRLFLARASEDGGICLLVVQAAGAGAAACTPGSAFSDDGLQLGGGRYEAAPGMTILTESYTLRPNGDFAYDATARQDSVSPPPGYGSIAPPDLH